MAAFSHQECPFIHDSVFQSNNPINNSDPAFFSQFYQSDESPLITAITYSDNKNTDSSSMADKVQNNTSENISHKRKNGEYSAQSKDARTGQGKKQRKSNVTKKEKKKVDNNKEEEAPLGYIHVRARRGQATDSHSLAERVRREKISERMKLLQALVPGCDKITGKALMLDEIINYVQSLQNQVEFLSMKLASLNPMIYDFGVDVDPDVAYMTRQCSPNEPTVYADSIITTTTPASFTAPQLTNQTSYLDHPFLLHQGQMLNLPTLDCDGGLFWDGPKQKFMNPSSLINNDNLCSFL